MPTASPSFKLAPASLPQGERIYAIGDIHGCRFLLQRLHQRIADDLAARPVAKPRLIHLGDYIDRGSDSAGVLDTLLSPPPVLRSLAITNLMGNHEAMFLAALRREPGALQDWLRAGGDACLENWGMSPRRIGEGWQERVPERHRQLVTSLELMVRRGGYVFVHAGIRPGVALTEQAADDVLWIRDPFLDFEGKLPAVVVHGHTPEQLRPVVRSNRINLDTAAVYGGPLTCVVLEEDRMAFMSVKSGER